VLHPFVADLVACHARADILRRMWLELDWEQHRHWATSEPGLATKAMVMAAAAKWGLGHAKVRVFQDVFDESSGGFQARATHLRGPSPADDVDLLRQGRPLCRVSCHAAVPRRKVRARRAGTVDAGTRWRSRWSFRLFQLCRFCNHEWAYGPCPGSMAHPRLLSRKHGTWLWASGGRWVLRRRSLWPASLIYLTASSAERFSSITCKLDMLARQGRGYGRRHQPPQLPGHLLCEQIAEPIHHRRGGPGGARSMRGGGGE